MGAASSLGGCSLLSNDAKVKVVNQMAWEHSQLTREGLSDAAITARLIGRLTDLVSLYSTASYVCPRRRFGRTELQMPVLTLGGMRQQQTWSPPADFTAEDIKKEVQNNFEAIADRAMALGINHFETARGYGTSEIQYAPVIRKYPRESFILQTKVCPQADTAKFRELLEKSFEQLGLTKEGDYVDLFSFHGVNKPEHIDMVIRDGGNLSVIKEYQSAGKIRFIGFSTHGMVPTIVDAINTGIFDYCNIHLHWCGSYTATGTGLSGGNEDALAAAKAQDMGVFIISPTDKGGALYEPPALLQKACAPISPISWHNLLLLSDERISTLVIGAARPSDFDEHLDAVIKYDQRVELSAPIMKILEAKVTSSMGSDFFTTWYKSLPDAYQNPLGQPVGYIYWLWWISKFWGLQSFAQKRYASLEGNMKDWDDQKTEQENKTKFSWVPGLPFRPEQEQQLRDVLAGQEGLSPARIDHVMTAVKEAHHWLREGGIVARGDVVDAALLKDWTISYNLQPDKPFPERA